MCYRVDFGFERVHRKTLLFPSSLSVNPEAGSVMIPESG